LERGTDAIGGKDYALLSQFHLPLRRAVRGAILRVAGKSVHRVQAKVAHVVTWNSV
jgi:hypothetical protein